MTTHSSFQNYDYDVIVVGARAAGAATALLLAREGLDVLVVDRAAYGSETTSTHALLAPGVMLLEKWGVLDALVASDTPAIESTTMTYDDQPITFDLAGRSLYAPARTVIDPLLADMASLAGADVRFETPVRELLRTTTGPDSGRVNGIVIETSAGPTEVRAPLVIGADGMRSFVARQVEAPVTYRGKNATACVMAYFDGIDRPGSYNWHHAVEAAAGSIPTNDGLYSVFGAVSSRRFRAEMRTDIAAGFHRALGEASPELARRVKASNQVTRFRSFPGERSFTRQAAGPGWALVGDAGSFIDPMTAHGMSAAFRDAQACAEAVAGSFATTPDPSIWERYEAQRDEIAHPMIDAIDEVSAFRYDLGRVQKAHIALSKLVGAEVAHISGRTEAVDPCSQAAA